jgi:hypothetical protein
MIENNENQEIDIPTEGSGWFDDLPKGFENYPNYVYYSYTTDDDIVKKEEVAIGLKLANVQERTDKQYSLNIFVRNDLPIEKKRIAFLHELYESYYIECLGMSKEEAHKKAEMEYSFK